MRTASATWVLDVSLGRMFVAGFDASVVAVTQVQLNEEALFTLVS
jgi:hypothetical protein